MEIHWYKTFRHVAVLLPVNTGHFYICGELQTTSEPLPVYCIIITATAAGFSLLTLYSHSFLLA